MFRIIFVLDILNGKVVHAVKGEREKYGPVHNFSKVCESSDPLHIVDDLSPRELYIADLNRLEGMLDLGASTMDEVHLGQEMAGSVILGTETATFELVESASSFYPRSINLSIDIKDGNILTNEPAFDIPPIKRY